MSVQDLGALVSPGWEVEGVSSMYSTTWTPLPLPSSLAVPLILAGAWGGIYGWGKDSFPSATPQTFGALSFTQLLMSMNKRWADPELPKGPSKEDAPFSSVPVGPGQHANKTF